jgi:hypothetical protein
VPCQPRKDYAEVEAERNKLNHELEVERARSGQERAQFNHEIQAERTRSNHAIEAEQAQANYDEAQLIRAICDLEAERVRAVSEIEAAALAQNARLIPQLEAQY